MTDPTTFTGRKAKIRDCTANLPLNGPNSLNSYHAAWGLPPCEGKEMPSDRPSLAERAAAIMPKFAPPPSKQPVGDKLHEILAECGIVPKQDCGCTAWIRKMNEWGVVGCRLHSEEIHEHLRKAAHESSWLAMAKVAIHGYLSVESLLNEAIKRTIAPVERPKNWLPSKDDPMTPVPSDISDTRNLLYHVWANTKSNWQNPSWKVAIRQLLKRMDLFNGVRSVAIATDDKTASVTEVKRMFESVRIDNWMEFRNDPKRRETISFVPLMETLPNDDSVTFWSHTKGAQHQPDSITLRWADEQYRLLCDYWPDVREGLKQFPVVCSFKRYQIFGKKCQYRWHPSGGVWWMRQADVFAKSDWKDQIEPWFAGTESWPGGVFPSSQALCIGPDEVQNLYQQREWDRIQSELDAVYRRRNET